jgi:hypothetical protein
MSHLIGSQLTRTCLRITHTLTDFDNVGLDDQIAQDYRPAYSVLWELLLPGYDRRLDYNNSLYQTNKIKLHDQMPNLWTINATSYDIWEFI